MSQLTDSSDNSTEEILAVPVFKNRAGGSARCSETTLAQSANAEEKSDQSTADSTQADDEGDEDGGFLGWMAVLGCYLIQFTGFGYSNGFGVYQDYYVRIYLSNFSSSVVSWIGSVQIFLQLGIGILAGRLFDRGYFYSVVIGGSVIYVFSLFMLSLSKPQQYYQVFLAQAIGVGAGSGLSYVPSMALLAQYFRKPHRRALVMSIVASGSSLGGTLHPIMLNNLFNGRVGFQNGVRASAGLITGCLVLAICAMHPRRGKHGPTPKEGQEEKAEEVLKNSMSSEPKKISLGTAIIKFLRDPPYLFLVISIVLFSQGFFLPLFYLQLDANAHNLDPTFAFYSLAIMNGCSVIGRLTPGLFVRRVGVFNMLIFCAFICSGIVFAMFGLHDLAGVVGIGIPFGFFSGAYISLLAPVFTLLADNPSEIGARIGLGFFFQGLGGLVASPIIGALLTEQNEWWRAIIYCGVLSTASCLTYAFCREYYKKKRGIRGWLV